MSIIKCQIYLAFICSVIFTKPLSYNSSNKWRRDDTICDYLYEDCSDDDNEFYDTIDGKKKKSKNDKLLLEKYTKDLENKYKEKKDSIDSLEDPNHYDRMFTDMHEHSDDEFDDNLNESKEKSKKEKLLPEKDTHDSDNKDEQDSSMDSLEDFDYYDRLFSDMDKHSDYEFNDTINRSKEKSTNEKILLEEDTNDLENKDKSKLNMDSLEYYNYEDRMYTVVHEFSVQTKTNDPMRFFPVSQESVQFKVRSAHDAFLWFTKEPFKEDNPKFCEVYLGGHENLRSGIRRNEQDDMVSETPDILSEEEFRAFWVKWDSNAWSVGRKGEKKHFIKWEDPHPFHVSYVGVESRHGATATWVIQGVYEVLTESTNIWWVDGQTQSTDMPQTLPLELADCRDDARCRFPFSKKPRKSFDLP